jgi:hypothetical protein
MLCGCGCLHCAQELNPKLGRARGLDLHSVAARLEQGLYQATGQQMEVSTMEGTEAPSPSMSLLYIVACVFVQHASAMTLLW